MFDKLKEVQYFKETTESNNVKYFKKRKRLENLQKAKAYLEPKRVSTMELFVKILNDLLFFQ